MHCQSIIAACALFSAALAIPLQKQQHVKDKRDLIWETSTVEDVVTVAVTTTVWLNPGEETPKAHYGHGRHTKQTSVIHQTVTIKPVPVSEPTEAAPIPSAAAPTKQKPPPAPPVETEVPAPAPAPAAPKPPPAPKPAPEPAPAPPAPKPEPAPQPPSTGRSSGMTGLAASGTSYTGDFTWYDTGLGACGITSGSSEHVVAIAESLFDSYYTANPNENPLCGKTVLLTGVDGTEYPAKIVDRCGGCAQSDLDLSQDFFNLVTSNGDGRVSGMEWSFA